MNLGEAAKAITIAAAYDGRIAVDQLSIQAWLEILQPYTFDDVKKVILEHERTGNLDRSLRPGDIHKRLAAQGKNVARSVETDVRSAKARRIVPQDWPADKPLEPAAQDRLDEARRREWEQLRAIGRMS